MTKFKEGDIVVNDPLGRDYNVTTHKLDFVGRVTGVFDGGSRISVRVIGHRFSSKMNSEYTVDACYFKLKDASINDYQIY